MSELADLAEKLLPLLCPYQKLTIECSSQSLFSPSPLVLITSPTISAALSKVLTVNGSAIKLLLPLRSKKEGNTTIYYRSTTRLWFLVFIIGGASFFILKQRQAKR
ncbi:hypothetical protein ACTFIW_008969 [Dictyostelium discoideum]